MCIVLALRNHFGYPPQPMVLINDYIKYNIWDLIILVEFYNEKIRAGRTNFWDSKRFRNGLIIQ